MIQRRNMLKQALLYIITFSLYGIYWFYVTSTEMVSHKGLSGSPGLLDHPLVLGAARTLLLLAAEQGSPSDQRRTLFADTYLHPVDIL